MNKKKENGWKLRCAEQERVIELCNQALELIPTTMLERGYDWVPSPEAILKIRVAKDSVRDFLAVHFHGGNVE